MAANTVYGNINDLVSAIYKDFANNDNYINLFKLVTKWENQNPNANELDVKNLFSSLQNLEDHLTKNALIEQSEKISKILIQVFPELLFPALPTTNVEASINLSPLKDLKRILRIRNYPDVTKEAAREFEENLMKAVDNLDAFAKDVELGHFRERGSGVAGELFRQFKAIVLVLNDPALADIPWDLLNQLALKLNNDHSAYNAAYKLLKNLNSIKTAKPSTDLNTKIKNHTIFFQRNYLWEELDKSKNSHNYRNVLKIINKLIPLVNSNSERTNLRLLKKHALEKIEGTPRGCIILIISIIFALGLISLFSDKNIPKRKKIKKLILTNKKKIKPDNTSLTKKTSFKGNSGLLEELPPIQPYDQSLTLAQVRYAMYQQQRISYLKGLKLNKYEEQKLNALIADWKKRCLFYKYNAKDREQVDFEVKNYKSLLLIDANDILKSWRKNKTTTNNLKKLLNLTIPTYATKVQTQLKALGFYKGQITGKWDAKSKRALTEFKATNAGIINDKWDLQTQKILFNLD